MVGPLARRIAGEMAFVVGFLAVLAAAAIILPALWITARTRCRLCGRNHHLWRRRCPDCRRTRAEAAVRFGYPTSDRRPRPWEEKQR